MENEHKIAVASPKTQPGDNRLQLSPISVNEDYLEKWNERSTDFVCLTRNGELVRETLYRIGGINSPKPESDEYFMLLKYTEAYYPDNITKDKKQKPHLKGEWCIIDKHGNEKVQFKQFDHPYLVKDSVIYSMNGKYYNIETGELYCDSSTTMQCEDYLFLSNAYDRDKDRRGVMRIHKRTDQALQIYSCDRICNHPPSNF
ncbi:hypothetical protein DAPPUDRAFT_124480 [Daphnia pulex]|uniref:Uncharacterized protein n=1 Tax=Daphnia pulex TaxID=6669 RepID=E9I6M9_DAPPU|nr:hypothetical protein DAPPUDRAFT_124480 [Daphnia pulex]|eukprot:EFX60351.1 hypothetical protein DAPPUDRAFT_124480 [Daphnia pulex]